MLAEFFLFWMMDSDRQAVRELGEEIGHVLVFLDPHAFNGKYENSEIRVRCRRITGTYKRQLRNKYANFRISGTFDREVLPWTNSGINLFLERGTPQGEELFNELDIAGYSLKELILTYEILGKYYDVK
jgi:hypothetical protein